MLHLVHLLIVVTYILLPILAFMRARRGARIRRHRFLFACFGGLAMGVTVCGVSAMAQHGRVSFGQVLLASYFATSLLLVLKGFDRLLWLGVRRVFSLGRPSSSKLSIGLRGAGGLLVRTVILFGIGLPYVFAASMTYHVRVTTAGDPDSLYRWSFVPISFSAVDGVRLAGWWIPSGSGYSSKTVIVCPGLAGTKASQLALARRLVPGGYNVLIFDFRGIGESGGQLTSFGDLERKDVLGAVQWLTANHPHECRKIVGIGASTGAAALISAAADSSWEGQRIDAVAVYGSFDRLDSVAESIIDQYVPPPMNWCIRHIGLPLASLQVGADLGNFSPADSARKLSPRPILVIHGVDDEIVSFDHGQSLYDAAFQPKYYDWIDRAGHEDVMESDAAARYVKHYFDSAGNWL